MNSNYCRNQKLKMAGITQNRKKRLIFIAIRQNARQQVLGCNPKNYMDLDSLHFSVPPH